MSVESRTARVIRALLGDRPAVVLTLFTPTLLAIALDFALRARALLVYPPLEIINYTGSSFASAGFWGPQLWLSSRLFLVAKEPGPRRIAARIGLAAHYLLIILPFATFSFGGQPLYHRVFHAYMARDTVRLGIALRGTLGAWLSAWGGSFLLMLLIGLIVTTGFAYLARRAAPALRSSWPIVPVLGFAGSFFCFWIDFVESRSLQAAPPDTCFIHGVVHALRDGITGKGWVRRGITVRTPAPLPTLPIAAHRPNVLVILSESVRADAMCSDPPPRCAARYLDAPGVAPERIALGKLTAQSSGTFTSCMVLWTGMPPSVDFATAHRAPILWEIAHAVGYRTGYITSQNLRYDDFGAFVRNAAIDVQVSATDLGDTRDPHVGAPDEGATARMLDFVRTNPAHTPWFAVMHFSNTHWPYRVDPAIQPYTPASEDPFGDLAKLHNHYRNSVIMQEHTLSEFLRTLRTMPGWDDTVVLFLSDHGEQFREHGGLYHINSLFDEELRIPGWLLAGPNALDDQQRLSLGAYHARRTYPQDVRATVLDLFGVLEARDTIPYANLATGRSLLRAPTADEPTAIMSTASGVWEPDDPKYGVMRGEHLLVGTGSTTWHCYDIPHDVQEQDPKPASACGTMIDDAKKTFPNLVPDK